MEFYRMRIIINVYYIYPDPDGPSIDGMVNAELGSFWLLVDCRRKETPRLPGHPVSQANGNLNDKLVWRHRGLRNSL